MRWMEQALSPESQLFTIQDVVPGPAASMFRANGRCRGWGLKACLAAAPTGVSVPGQSHLSCGNITSKRFYNEI